MYKRQRYIMMHIPDYITSAALIANRCLLFKSALKIYYNLTFFASESSLATGGSDWALRSKWTKKDAKHLSEMVSGCRVKIGCTSDTFNVGFGLRRGDRLTPLLLNIALLAVVK